jgi:hypothetical protein
MSDQQLERLISNIKAATAVVSFNIVVSAVAIMIAITSTHH